jgi:prefoldin alpha subunit
MSIGGGGAGRQELEQLSEQIEELREQQEQLEAAIEGVHEEQAEIDDVIDGLETLETGDTVQVPLGAGAYVRAEVQEMEEVVVSVGGGYAVEQPDEDAAVTLDGRKDLLDDRIDDLEEELEELQKETESLEQQAQQAQQQLMQQMQQQQGGGE